MRLYAVYALPLKGKRRKTDRHALIGACMNPHIDERAAVRLARDGGDVAVEYLRDNETLDPVFRDMLARSDED